MERLSEAITHALENQRGLMLDPVSAVIVLLIVFAFFILRITRRRKTTKQRIAEMEDADFPIDEEPDPPTRA